MDISKASNLEHCLFDLLGRNVFGGRSAEHDVSVLSATNVMRALDPAKFDAVSVYITRERQWLLSSFEDGETLRAARKSASCQAERDE